MIGWLIDGDIEVGVGDFTMTTQRSKVVDFTVPIYESLYVLLTFTSSILNQNLILIMLCHSQRGSITEIIDYGLEIWSSRVVLNRCFLPPQCPQFSVSKSLNRYRRVFSLAVRRPKHKVEFFLRCLSERAKQ